MRAYIFDIDGTLSDPSHRLHHIQGDTQDWTAFYAACDQDAPIPHMIELVKSVLHDDDNIVLFCTGRSDEVRIETLGWLHKHVDPYLGHDDLYMRAAGDHQVDTVVKAELMDRIKADGYEPIIVFEDRASVVRMWRARGIPCAQVAEGNY